MATAKITTFTWEGTNRSGKKTTGEAKGASMAIVKADLQRQGITTTKVKKKAVSIFGGKGKGKKITPSDIALFSRQLSTMMTAGVPLVQSFDIIAQGNDNPKMQDLLYSVKADLEGGNQLADALAKHPLIFDDLFCSLIHAGEQAGILEELLDKIATYKEKIENIKSKIKKALYYPVAIVFVAFIVTTIIMLFVVPQFQQIFSNFGADLPALTMVVINMSQFMQDFWWAVFGGMFACFYTLARLNERSKKFREHKDRWLLKAPVVGDLLTKAAIARFARTLSTMFAAGTPLVEAMGTVAEAAGNSVYTKAIRGMKDEIATGQLINVSMQDTGLFPNLVIQMVAIGEETGSVDVMLSKVADYYEEQVDDMVDGLSSLLEPIIMAFLGVIIGGLVIAMYLPIFKMGEVV